MEIKREFVVDLMDSGMLLSAVLIGARGEQWGWLLVGMVGIAGFKLAAEMARHGGRHRAGGVVADTAMDAKLGVRRTTALRFAELGITPERGSPLGLMMHLWEEQTNTYNRQLLESAMLQVDKVTPLASCRVDLT